MYTDIKRSMERTTRRMEQLRRARESGKPRVLAEPRVSLKTEKLTNRLLSLKPSQLEELFNVDLIDFL